MEKIATMNPYVGMAKAIPLSRTPRKFIKVTTKIKTTDVKTKWRLTDGAVEAMFCVAEAIETATVIT